MTQPPVTLANCADEPIHIPGAIQPHGALLAFDRAGRLAAWSANAAAVLGFAPSLDSHYDVMPLTGPVKRAIEDAVADLGGDDPAATVLDQTVSGVNGDCIVHAARDRVIAEFELHRLAPGEAAAFALKAHAAIDRLKRQKDVPALLRMAVQQVRAITGFDRVMAYRFRHDDSGDVVAEDRDETLEPFLGMRYPASDIPAQARRLYTINTLRLIADVGYTPVSLAGRAGDPPLDMSHGVLRSVSPIHVEYLQNMGVGASMSVSIVINGRLWGLLACHHMGPRQVPYSIRMACDVMAQVLASTVQSIEARAHADLVEQAAAVRTRALESVMLDDDVLHALAQHAPALAAMLEAEALIFAVKGKVEWHGDLTREQAAQIVAALPADGPAIVHRTGCDDWSEEACGALGKWLGVLALRFDATGDGWLVALRAEQIESVRWAGKPEKIAVTGPLGPRLTPRGSFEEWVETVRGQAIPWDAARLEIADQLLAELQRASAARHAETDRARTQLLAMLGHDLRDPLHSINMAASVLEQGAQGERIGRRIQASSHRMQRLISQVLDATRINNGMGLGLHPEEVDIVALIEDLIDEARTAHPGVTYETALPETLKARVDPDRIAQVFSNLLSNARHHGPAGEPVRVRLQAGEGEMCLEVRNAGEPIEPHIAATLFNPFKHTSLGNRANRGGLGLGLYIASQIVAGHGGTLTYRHEDGEVVFEVRLPLAA